MRRRVNRTTPAHLRAGMPCRADSSAAAALCAKLLPLGGSMRRLASIMLVLLSTSICFSQSDSSVRSSIEQVLNAQVQAWNNHDLEKFMQGYWHSPELTFFSGGQVSHGWDEALDRYRKHYQGQGHEMGK